MAVNIDGNGLIALGGTSSTQGRLRLAEDTDNGTNYIELTAPASVGSDRVITFPDATTTVVGTDTTQTLTNKTLGSGLVMGASAVTSATAQASTSGTSIDFTGIPSWVKRITVILSGVSTNGGSPTIMRLGTSGGFVTTGYAGGGIYTGAGTSGGNRTDGLLLCGDAWGAGAVANGHAVLTNISGNSWVQSFVFGQSDSAYSVMGGGRITLSGALTQVRITTVSGTETFDDGSINIFYE